MNENLGPSTEFYQTHLDRVSRSFAFCIRELRQPLRARVALAYLICRILDTIEDSTFETSCSRFEQIERFQRFIGKPPSPDEFAEWLARFPKSIPIGERRLLDDGERIFADFHSLPQGERQIIGDTVLSMARGMAYFLRRGPDRGHLWLGSLVEVNRYCFFVAGVVGEMLTRLLAQANPQFVLTDERILAAHQFGLFLQKINILKDQLGDERIGRHLVPEQDELWASVSIDVEGAMGYLLDLPIEEREYRLFCAWSLFLGLASMPWIKKSWTAKILEKIPRIATERLLRDVASRIDHNKKLQELFEGLRPTAFTRRPRERKAIEDSAGFLEFPSLYIGKLAEGHLAQLGLV